jgi:fibronectin type 3 domain-containing protein/regulation of enolase protein 1 (concanavalin A-like superfamily)
MRTERAFFVGLSCLLIACASAEAQTSDTLVFGNTASEANHGLTAYFPPPTNITTVSWQNTPAPSDPSATGPSDVVAGLGGLSARRLLPRTPNADVYGGQITFTMAVDPAKQNYFTLKMSAADPNGQDFLILNCDGKEIGARHGGNTLAEDMLWSGGSGWWLGRFFYRTEPLPLAMTYGKTSVTITVRASGSLYDYAPVFTYVPQYQSLLAVPSEGLYTAYTHAGSLVDATGETQGSTPAVQTPNTLFNETTQLNNVMSSVNAQLASDLQNTPANLSQNDAGFLAGCYDALTNAGATYITFPSGQSNATLAAQVVAILDNAVTSYAAGSGIEGSDWGGGLGPMGDAVRLTWPLISGSMSTMVNYGGTLGTTTRSAAWAKALRASVDAGRYNRQNIGNQAIDNGTNIYRANRGCLLVNSASALNESEALRYPKEGCGILPWLGNDQATGGTDGLGGGPTPTRGVAPYGPNWFMCTTKGLTKDGDGFVGGDYGEVGPFVYRFGLISGDAQLQARGLAMTRARLPFRYPGVDGNGYLVMLSPDPIGDRNNPLPGHVDYLGQSNSDDFLMASQGASVIGNDILGAFQEEITQGQIYQYFYALDPYLPPRWAAIKAMAPTNVPLPTTSGQPDFAWADEQDMVVAAKHGEERLFVNLFWRSQLFINGFAKVFQLTPSLARLGDVFADDVRFRATGQTLTAGGIVDGFATPEDNPQEAFAGTPEPVAFRSDLSSPPATNRDGGRGTGYTLRYGNWLIGIDADYSATYPVKLPSNFTSATDLISGQVMSGPVTLQPQTTVVFYLPDTSDPAPTPARSLFLGATGSNGAVSLRWSNAGAATSYNVLRSTTSGSGYAAIASGLTNTSYTDTAVTNGTTYYYVVTATNSIGTSGNSAEAAGKPVAPETVGLAAPWTDFDEGVSTGGSATLSGGNFTVVGGPGNLDGASQGFHMVYQAISGDCVITAKVNSITNSAGDSNANAGVILRDSLLPLAEMAEMKLRPSGSADFNFCGGDGGSIVGSTLGASLPSWVRLVRTGLTITGSISSDGTTWTTVGSYIYSSLPYTLYAGLAVNSDGNTAGESTTAVFSNLSFPLGASVAPSTPTGLAATASTGSVALAWTTVNGAASYNVKRGTSSSGPFTTVGTGLVATSFTDYAMASGTYYYVVSAINSAGESANSTAVSVQEGGALPSALTGLNAALSTGQVALTWTATSGASSYKVTRTVVNGTPAVIASGLTMTNYTDTTPVDGTVYEYGVVPVNANGTGQGAAVEVMPPGGLPANSQSQDIGQQQTGGTSYANGVYTVSASGGTVFNAADVFHYTYQTVAGDFVYTARLAGVQNNAGNSYEAGIMVRNTTDAGSAEVSILTTSNGGFSTYNRSSTGGSTSYGGGGGFPSPTWLRLVRVGGSVSLYISTDGKAYTYAGTSSATLNTTVTVGLAVSSESSSTQDAFTFDNVSLVLDTAVGGTATADSQNNGNGQGAAQAFDGDVNSKWLTTDSGNSGWLQYQYSSGSPQVVTQYQIDSASDVPQRDPAAWQFLGSNDGTTWTTLDTQSGQVFANRQQANSYPISNVQPYQYYRLNVTANAGGTGYGLQLAELALLAPAGGTATADSQNNGNGEGAAQAFDGNVNTKWYTTDSGSSAWLQYQYAGGATKVVTGYQITSANDVPQRDPDNWQFLGSNDGTTWTTLDTQSGQTFASRFQTNNYPISNTQAYQYYRLNVTANAGGTGYGVQLSELTLITAPGPILPPVAPATLAASWSTGQIGLSWASSISATGYNLKRATTSGGPYTTISSGLTATTYTDTGLTNGTAYYYVVTAVNAGGESPNSPEDSATPYAPPAAPTGLAATASGQQVALSWASVSNAASYNIKRATTSGGPYTKIGAATSPSYADPGLAGGVTYYYVVTAVNLDAESAASSQASAITALSSPGGFTATPGNAQAVLSWTAVSNATSYHVKRATTSGGTYTTVGSPTTTTYTNTGLTNGATYYYVVTAVNSLTESANSYQLSATPGTTAGRIQYGDVGSVGTAGSTSYSNGTYTLNGSGADIYGTADAFQFASQPVTGDVTLVVCVASQSTNSPGKSGLMIRETTAANAKYVDLVIQRTSGAKMEYRTSTGGSAANAGSSGGKAAPYWLKLVRAGNVFTGSMSPDGTTWTQLAQVTLTMNSAVQVGLAECAVNNSVLASATFTHFSVVALPSPWQSADVGTVAATGSAIDTSGVFEVTGSGADIGGTADAFRYTSQAGTGDCDITTRVTDVQNTNALAKAGVMIRETLNNNSSYAMVAVTPSSGIQFNYRNGTGAAATVMTNGGLSTPYWVRVARAGNVFTASCSPNGTTWTTIGSATISMSTSVYIGLPVTSRADGTLNTATMDNVTADP